MKKIATLAETFFVPLAPHCASTLLGCRDRRGETCQDARPAEQESGLAEAEAGGWLGRGLLSPLLVNTGGPGTL